MNEQALIHFINIQLNTFVHICSPTGFLMESFPPYRKTQDVFIQWTQLQNALTDFSETNDPRLVSINTQMVYASVKTPEKIYIIGPVRFDSSISLRVSLYNPHLEENWTEIVPLCNFETFIEFVLLTHNLYAESLLPNDILALQTYNVDESIKDIQTSYSAMLFERQENEVMHNPYDQEIRLLDSIAQGDLKALESSWHEQSHQSYGMLSPTPLRNVKNLCIAVVTLASRAAIKGGLSPEISFNLCDSYIQKVETCKDSLSCSTIVHECQRYYTQLNAESRRTAPSADLLRPTPHLTKCKDYIYAHLHDQISIQEIADAVHLNATYLAGLFKKYEGCTIHHFILTEKINLVKNLLKYSDYTYTEIATYLGFSSQSHLGAQFKKITGFTLREYRVQYGAEQFR